MTHSSGISLVLACVAVFLACPAYGTSRGLSSMSSSSESSSINDPTSLEGFQQARYYLSDEAAGSEAVIVEEEAGLSEMEEDSITQSMLAQVAQVFGSLLGGKHKHHHHNKKHEDASFPSYQPPQGWVPPGGYPYAPSPSGGGKELPFTTGSTVSIRSPALNKYCKVSKDTDLLQCDQDEPSSFMDGLLVLGENYMTNKIMEGDTITLKVQIQNTVCGVDDSVPDSPIKCEGRTIEPNAKFMARFAPGSSKDAPMVQLLPASEEEDDEPWGLVGDEDDDEEVDWFELGDVDIGGDESIEYDYDYYNEYGDNDAELEGDAEEVGAKESKRESGEDGSAGGSASSPSSGAAAAAAAEAAAAGAEAEAAAGAAGDGAARARLLSGTVPLGEGEDRQAVLEEMQELNNQDAKKEGVYKPKARQLQERKARDEGMGMMEAEAALVEEGDEDKEAEAEEEAWAMEELAGSMEGFVEELEEDLPAPDYEVEKRKKAKKERLCAPSEEGHAHTVECTKHRADERITFLEIVPTNPYA